MRASIVFFKRRDVITTTACVQEREHEGEEVDVAFGREITIDHDQLCSATS